MAKRPAATSEESLQRMKRQGRRDTRPEVRVRSTLHAMGVRFRIDVAPEPDLRVRGDLVWRNRKIVVFIDGCFWHRCPDHASIPKLNRTWWESKLAANVARDERYSRVLAARGWTVLRFWEHEDPSVVAAQIVRALGGTGSKTHALHR